jgi:transposase
MFEELGMGHVIDHATQHSPETRFVTVGSAVKTMVLNGLGCVTQQLDLVPMFFQHKPTQRLVAPGIEATQRNDDALGRALDTLSADGVTELYSLIAATAAERLGLAPRVAHLDRTSLHLAGRDHREAEPAEQVIHITRGDSRDQRPDLNQVLLALVVEHRAGLPGLMTPRSGNSSDAQDCGAVVNAPIAPLPTTYGTT